MKTETTIILRKKDFETLLEKELKEKGLKVARIWFYNSPMVFLCGSEGEVQVVCEPTNQTNNKT